MKHLHWSVNNKMISCFNFTLFFCIFSYHYSSYMMLSERKVKGTRSYLLKDVCWSHLCITTEVYK